MSPRPRETSDAELLAAASRVMERRSPVELTLADVATEAGVSPATLIQRFGTKRELLLANCKAWTAGIARQFAAARAKHGSARRTLVEYLVNSSGFAATPEAVANFLAHLQIDLTDPDFYVILRTQSETAYRNTKKLLDEAVSQSELKPCDTGALARLIQQISYGALLDWAVQRRGSLAAWIRRSVRELLRPYETSRKKKAGRS